MPWLLDTHVWLWSQIEPERLGPTAVAVLERPDEVLYVATVSTLELACLVAAGRVTLQVSVAEWVDATLAELAAATLELTHPIAAAAYCLPGEFHRDPADRLLVATARQHALVILTADRRILEYAHVRSQDASH
ncbi:MAG: type II toxin-antitoxin system VapC family toxin [Armatimonadetes bacterium]|nr:type II toxin-antitoxin system VapC family toxin [Armatimonadota bacterium]